MKDNRGATLIELVVAIAILSTILLSIYSFYLVGVKSFTRETTTVVNQTDIRRASNEIARQIRRAEEINIDGSYLLLTLPDEAEVKVISYKQDGNKLEARYYNSIDDYDNGNAKSSSVIAERVKVFNVGLSGTPNPDQVTIEIKSIENTEGVSEELNTTLTIRK